MTNQPEQQRAVEVKDQHWPRLLAKPNVVGVGIGLKQVDSRQTAEVGVIVLVKRKIPLAGLTPGGAIPRQIDGVPTDVVQVGEIHARQTPASRWRPCPGGVSIGHYRITAGTSGCVVRDRLSGTRLILSNNHVLANSNNAVLGDPILQPGPTDGGRVEADRIAVLERFQPINFNVAPPTSPSANRLVSLLNWIAKLIGSQHRLLAYRQDPKAVNQADAAVARPLNDADILDEIYQIGVPSGTDAGALGMAVRKSGRTSGLTTGTINLISATISVSYSGGRSATFENQLVAGPMSQGGDSGSLVVEAGSTRAVGLLFAGSEATTVFTPIQAVLDILDVIL